MKCWVRMPSQMLRIHKMVTQILPPPTIEIDKKLTEFISTEKWEIAKWIKTMSTGMLICRRGMGRLSDTCERCDARTALGQQHQHGFGQCPPPPLPLPFKINFFIRCSSMKTLYNCVLSPDTLATKNGNFWFWHFATANRVPAAAEFKFQIPLLGF